MHGQSNTSLVVRHRFTTGARSQPEHLAVVPWLRQIVRSLAWFARTWWEIWREWHTNERCLRALAELGDEDLPHLSEAGQRLRREARRHPPSY